MTSLINEEYTDEMFLRDFPERLTKCNYCHKKFLQQMDAKYCSDLCFRKQLKCAKTWRDRHPKPKRKDFRFQ